MPLECGQLIEYGKAKKSTDGTTTCFEGFSTEQEATVDIQPPFGGPVIAGNRGFSNSDHYEDSE
jgi:hypothetical protein